MRLAYLLPILMTVSVPAVAQSNYGSGMNFGPLVTWPGMSQPVDGWGADRGNFGQTYLYPPKLVEAHRLVAEGRYAEANPLLNEVIGQSSSSHARFLKGVTALGMGDPKTARRYFEKVLPGGGRVGSPGAMSGLALAEIRLGNVNAAQNILSDLRYQERKSHGDRKRIKAIRQAIDVVERELA